MAILGSLLKKGLELRESLEQKYSSPFDLQKNELRKNLIAAKDTYFGHDFGFEAILRSFTSEKASKFYDYYKETVPIYDYDKIFDEYWYRSRQGESNVTWPGQVKYFAMSSGTSGDSSKYIPVTKDMLKAIKNTSTRQLLALSRFDLPSGFFKKGILMLGGSTALKKVESFYEGDLSGITADNIPFWFQHFYKPGKKISQNPDWGSKLEEITSMAPKWDISIIVGVPAWIQLLMEKIIDQYGLNTIHDIWPNLSIYVHGGVAFQPYKKGFEKLLGKPIQYIETYLASEGFIAFQAYPHRTSMKLVLNGGIFFEFVPFNDENFDAEGKIRDNATSMMIDEVEEGKEYAILLSTCAGAWRYLIGDTIKFINKKESEIIITGRTKHFLSLCGEHLSVDNMNQAVKMLEDELNITIREFTVAGVPEGTLFGHKWYLGTDEKVDKSTIATKLDRILCKLNDDYCTERKFALKEITVEIIPAHYFYDWMRIRGKEGAQNKFPRVMKGPIFEEWEKFLVQHNIRVDR